MKSGYEMNNKIPPSHQNVRQISRLITDLDQSDNNTVDIEQDKQRVHQHRHNYNSKFNRKTSANNNISRSRSADKQNEVLYFKQLIETKDEQIEKLIHKISDLHNYNNEFAQENEGLQCKIQSLNGQITNLSRSLKEYQQKTCEHCSTWIAEKENLTKDNKLLYEDVTMVKTLVYRLNVQVERYQDKFRKCKINCDEDSEMQNIHSVNVHNQVETLKWGAVNAHTLGPLLNAYDEIIHEKEDLVNQYEIEINRFTGNLKETLEENERLQKEIYEIRKCKDSWREERTRLQAQLDICRSKAELQTRRGDLAKEKLVEVLHCYEQKVQSQSLDIERIQEAYSRAKGELNSYKNINTQPDALTEGWKECQKLFEELRSQYTDDKSKIASELNDLKQQNSELEDKLLTAKETQVNMKVENERYQKDMEETNKKIELLQKSMNKLKESRDRLKSRLRIALQWAHKLDESRHKMKNTWDDLKQLEAIVRHKESQIRGLHSRHIDEIGKLEQKLMQREETIKKILKDKANANI